MIGKLFHLIVLSIFILVITPAHYGLSKDYFDKIIDTVNNGPYTWKAGHNFDDLESIDIENMVGSIDPIDTEISPNEIDIYASHSTHPHHDTDVKEFDARQKWPNCPSIGHIPNQGKCASDWAIAPVSAITDRTCIDLNGTQNPILSPHEVISCCKKCGFGCKQGYPKMAYLYWIKRGLVTGGDYHSNKGCQPYDVKPCEESKACFLKSRSNGTTSTCKPYCYNRSYKNKYADDLYTGSEYFKGCPCCVTYNLMKYGPITATMVVYEDFLTYKSGIYKHATGKVLGRLTVKLIGFNDKSTPKYWLAVNSWGDKWGEKGLFKISRMEYECMIDTSIFVGMVRPEEEDD